MTSQLRLRAGDQRWIALTHADDPDRAEEALTPSRLRGAARAHPPLLGDLGRPMHLPRPLSGLCAA